MDRISFSTCGDGAVIDNEFRLCLACILLAEPLIASGCLNEFTGVSILQVRYVTLAINRFVIHVTSKGTIVLLDLVQVLALTLDH